MAMKKFTDFASKRPRATQEAAPVPSTSVPKRKDRQPEKRVNERFIETKKPTFHGKVAHFVGFTGKEALGFLKENNVSSDKLWYTVVEMQGEIHVVRQNDDGFKILEFVKHLAKFYGNNKKLNEAASSMKIRGNDSFAIITNVSPAMKKRICTDLVKLLSK